MTDLLASTCRTGHLPQCLQNFWMSSFNFHSYFITDQWLQICLVITQLQRIVLKMLTHYSIQEMADMHFMYDRANGNASAAQRFFFLRKKIS